MKRPTLSERFRYWFDRVLARGTGALIGLLALATLVFILIVAVIVELFGVFPESDGKSTPENFGEVLWQNMLRALDSGTFAGDFGWGYRVLMLLVTVFGILVVASLIGIVSGGFDERVAELRKGRSRVLETDHTLILGWSSKIIPIVSELVVANRSRKKAAIVILANRDKVEMEELLADVIADAGKTSVIIRSGDPMNLSDLKIANPHAARSIIILPADDASNPDAIVVKTTLAITNNPDRKAGKYHIVAEIQKPRYLDAARLVGKDEAHFVLSRDLISRIMVQTSRQSGLSVVYQALLDFEGAEIYFTEQPSLVGTSYLEVQHAFGSSTVIGIATGDQVHINPPASSVLAAADQLIVIAEDDSTIALSPAKAADASRIVTAKAPRAKAERTLVLGYHHGLPVMLKELSAYVPDGSRVTVVADRDVPKLGTFPNLEVEVERGDVTDGDVLEALGLEKFHHVLVLADRSEHDVQESDARTLITLLNLRDLEQRRGFDLKIVSEMLDDRNRELAEVTQADDFIVSDRLISLVLSQLSENRELANVFDILFSSSGSEIYLQDASRYVTPGAPVDFYTVLEAASGHGETAIGYRIAAQARDSAASYGVVMNPAKSELVSFAPGDKIVVLSAG